MLLSILLPMPSDNIFDSTAAATVIIVKRIVYIFIFFLSMSEHVINIHIKEERKKQKIYEPAICHSLLQSKPFLSSSKRCPVHMVCMTANTMLKMRTE